MDLITHGLFAYSISNSIRKSKKFFLYILIIGAIIPDLGEILIQNELSKKYGETIAVYDARTSDIIVASDLSVTFLYDTLHSLVLPILLIICALIVSNQKIKKTLQFLSIGLISHIFLDSFTHGKVWALKLFFPIINERFLILSDLVGNWWDWTPKFGLYFFKLPIYCVLIWICLFTHSYFIQKNEKK